MKYIANPVEVTALKITVVNEVDVGGFDKKVHVLTLEDGNMYCAGPKLTARHVPVPGDYLVTQSDGYVYLNPKDLFERKYRPQRSYVPLLDPQLEEGLSYHRPSPEQTERIELLRNAQKGYAAEMLKLCPASRALSIAKTEFETSCMWAVKSIVLEK